LLFMIPLPDGLMNAAVIGLQKGSAAVTAGLFGVIRMPFIRDGFRFALPGINIEIAEECSGIRSTLSIFLSGLLAADLFLQSSCRRIVFMLLIVPVVIFKNAVRIATIAWLGVYVDRRFFFGNLHHYGGLPFSLIAFAILGATLLMLRSRKPAILPAMKASCGG
jgi:exosortase